MALAAVLALPALAQTNFRHITFDEAKAAAKAENKMVFIDFYTSWCGPCKMMANQVFPQKEVGDYFNAKFVCVKYDAEKEAPELAKEFTVKAYPTFIVTDATGKVIGTKVGGNFDAQGFIEDIEGIANPDFTPERVKARYEGGERSAQVVSAYAKNLMEEATNGRRKPDQAKVDEANNVIANYFNSLTDEQKLANENTFIYINYASSLDSDFAKFMIANHDKFAEPAKTKVKEVMEKLYDKKVLEYVATKEKDADYETLKSDIRKAGLNDRFEGCFKLVEVRAQGSTALLDYCDKEFDNMDAATKRVLVSSISSMIDMKDKAVKERASKFLRSKLAGLEVMDIYTSVIQLYQIEQH